MTKDINQGRVDIRWSQALSLAVDCLEDEVVESMAQRDWTKAIRAIEKIHSLEQGLVWHADEGCYYYE